MASSRDREDEFRARPNPRGSRARTKARPQHLHAVPAQVVTVDRGRYGCLAGSFADPVDGVEVTAMKARELGPAAVVVGDRVALVGDVSGAAGSLARIVRVEERTSTLRRSADDDDPVERVLVANADQLAIVTALADPPPRTGLVDRCLVAAYDAGLAPLLVLTKADLAAPEPFLAQYASLDIPFVVTRRAGEQVLDLPDVAARLSGRVTVLVGHSGVGKSTLVNALVPGADRATGRVNAVTGRGRHTSTSALALRLPALHLPALHLPALHPPARPGWVVDTPGIRSFGLAHVDADRLLATFPDLRDGTEQCPRGCSHDEPECGLDSHVSRLSDDQVSSGRARLVSYRRLLRSLSQG